MSVTKDEIPVEFPTNYDVISKHNVKKFNDNIVDLQQQLDVSKNIRKDSMLREKYLRIQSLHVRVVEEMDRIRNESWQKEKEKDKRIYNLDKDFTEFKEQNKVKIDIGEKLLKLSKTKKWKGSIFARRLCVCSAACSLQPQPNTFLSSYIPVTIAAFFCDVDR